MKEVARSTDFVAAPNPRQDVENWIISGVSKEQIFWMLQSVHKLDADQCERLYALVESESFEHIHG